jgi:glycogen debranching enzyme
MGSFITAHLRVNGRSEAALRQAEHWLVPFKEHLSEDGLGHISEIFDGDAPHQPVGCIAQAWSVAEILRAAVEEIYAIQPQKALDFQSRTSRSAAESRPKAALHVTTT